MLELNQVYCGDCLEVMRDIADGSVDMICSDPPYGTTACAWDSIIPLDPMWAQLKRIIKPNGAIVLFGSQPFTSALIMSNIKMFKYEWIWDKVQPTGALTVKKVPMKQHENVLVFYSKQSIYNRQMTERKKKDVRINAVRNKNNQKTNFGYDHIGGMEMKYASDYDPTKINPKTIISFSKQPKRIKNVHPTQKPVALMEYLIKTYTNEEELVLDFCCGSGTTGVACKITKRNYIMIEKDATYFEIAKNRIENPDYKPTKVSKQLPGLIPWDELNLQILK